MIDYLASQICLVSCMLICGHGVTYTCNTQQSCCWSSWFTHQLLCWQVVEFEGKAAVPLSGPFKFRKAFFLHPKTDELCGRVDLQKGPLGNALYPLYYTASVTPSLIPGIVANLGICISALGPNKMVCNCCRDPSACTCLLYLHVHGMPMQ